MNEERKYRPSNGSEGEWFFRDWCDQCAAYNICKIWPATMAYGTDHPKYPKQWIYDKDDVPTCTSFSEKKSRGPKRIRDGNTIDMFGEIR